MNNCQLASDTHNRARILDTYREEEEECGTCGPMPRRRAGQRKRARRTGGRSKLRISRAGRVVIRLAGQKKAKHFLPSQLLTRIPQTVVRRAAKLVDRSTPSKAKHRKKVTKKRRVRHRRR